MKKKHIYLFTFFMIFVLCFSICTNVYAAEKKSKSYSLVVSGAGIGNGDKDEMEKILQNNKLYCDNSVWTFTYDTEAKGLAAGTTKKNYNKAIDTAYEGCTINDTAYFFHSGHGMEGFTKGWGLVLKNAFGNPTSWYGYDDLLKKLSNITCKHMVIIIQSCESGAVKKAYNKLPLRKKNKISLFWSSGANQKSYKKESVNVSIYGQTLIQLLGYNGNLYADINNDGNVTVRELGSEINKYIADVIEYHNTPIQTPGFCSAKNSNTIIYSDNIFELNKTSETIYKGSSINLSVTRNRTNKKITWKSSNPSVATVSSNGKVVGKKAGKVIITAKSNGLTVSCKVTVKTPSIKLDKTKAIIYTSGKKDIFLSATVKGASSKITWKSSNTAVATVNSKGKVTAKKGGRTIVTATANGKTAKCNITVIYTKSPITNPEENGSFRSLEGKGFIYKNNEFLYGVGFGKDDKVYIGVWNPSGTSSSYEDFRFEIVEGMYDYSAKGLRSGSIYDITLIPYKDTVKVSILCRDNSYGYFNLNQIFDYTENADFVKYANPELFDYELYHNF